MYIVVSSWAQNYKQVGMASHPAGYHFIAAYKMATTFLDFSKRVQKIFNLNSLERCPYEAPDFDKSRKSILPET
jgi:hypothetical protein